MHDSWPFFKLSVWFFWEKKNRNIFHLISILLRTISKDKIAIIFQSN